MIEFIKYFPLALRDFHGKVTPSGSFLKTMKPETWLAGDIKIHLQTPPSKTIWGFEPYGRKTLKISPGSGDILLQTWPYNGPSHMSSNWQIGHFYLKEWLFQAPWFYRHVAEMSLSGSIIKPNTPSYQTTSLYHPRVFENAIADFLSELYGTVSSGGKASYSGPHNWKPIKLEGGVSAAQLDIYQINLTPDNPSFSTNVFIPVAPNAIIRLSFNYIGVKLKGRVNPKPLIELTDRIISSIHLEIGKKVKGQLSQLQQATDNIQLSENFAQLKWPVTLGEIGKAGDSGQTTQKALKPS